MKKAFVTGGSGHVGANLVRQLLEKGWTGRCLVHKDTRALENLDVILEVDEIDVVYFGAYDLSQALGVPGETRHTSVLREIEHGLKKVNDNGKYAGGFVAQSKDDIKWLLDMGMRFITYEVDSSIVYKAVNEVTDWFGKELKK